MLPDKIIIQLEGSTEDHGHLRLNELIKQLELVASALKHTEQTVTGKDERRVYYRVVDLSHNSPVTCVLEAVPIREESSELSKRVVNNFIKNLRQINTKGRVPSRVDSIALESYKELGAMLDKNISSIKISNSSVDVTVDKSFNSKVESIIGPDEISNGSLTGNLEWINLHNANTFNIYPVVGAKKVKCHFPREMKETVISAIDKYVRVYGELRYKSRDNFPYAMNVEDLEILPDDNDLPNLFDLRGIAPQATGDLNSLDFIYSIRDGNW
jgi:hypothetical protein